MAPQEPEFHFLFWYQFQLKVTFILVKWPPDLFGLKNSPGREDNLQATASWEPALPYTERVRGRETQETPRLIAE